VDVAPIKRRLSSENNIPLRVFAFFLAFKLQVYNTEVIEFSTASVTSKDMVTVFAAPGTHQDLGLN